jgi:hypothetical protein
MYYATSAQVLQKSRKLTEREGISPLAFYAAAQAACRARRALMGHTHLNCCMRSQHAQQRRGAVS